MKVIAGLFVAGCVLSGLGCGGSSDGSDLSSEDRYLRSYLLPVSQSERDDLMRTTLQTEQAHVARCMRAAGFDYVPAPAESLFVAGTGFDLGNRDDVERFGFGISTIDFDMRASADNPNDKTFATLDTATQAKWMERIEGDEGCDAIAAREASAELGTQAAWAIAQQTHQVVDGDPAVRAAREAWRSCMQPLGYTAQSEPQLIEQLQKRWVETGTVDVISFRSEEKQTAVDSWECGSDLRATTADAIKAALQGIDPDAYARIADD